MNRVFIKTYGCQMNERDSEAVAAMLRKRGYVMVDHEDNADVVLLNTCSVRDQAEQKAIGKAGKMIKLKKQRPHLLVGIMGCMAQNRGRELLDRLPDLDLIVGTQKFHHVPDHLEHIIHTLQAQGPRPSTLMDIATEANSQNTIRDHIQDTPKISAYVSIMQGCNMQCAYCIVPTTRGPERSRSIPSIIEEVEELAQNGTKEITLLGQIVNSYGRRDIPFEGGLSPFVQLLEAIHNIPQIERIRFTSPHPTGFKSDLIEAFGRLPKLGSYIHLPLQSGSDTILKAMNRPYTQSSFRKLVEHLKTTIPDLSLSTDIIVGFPGETDEDFEATRSLFEELAFDQGFIFKYSVRPGTAAESLGDPISADIKDKRNQILLQLLEKQALKRHQSLIGNIEEVLVEGPARRGGGLYTGRTRSYRKVIFQAQERLIGHLLPIKITEATPSHLNGELMIMV